MSTYELIACNYFSEPWKAAEIEVVKRCFELGYVKRITRGRRKNQIQITSPGSGSRPGNISDGLFEAHVRAHAFRLYRDAHPMEEGMLSAFFAFSDLPGLDNANLAKAASVIGTWVGFAAAIWNDLGEESVDLWEMFRLDNEAVPAFVEFFRHCQEVRPEIDSGKSTKEVIRTIISELGEASATSRTPFQSESPEAKALALIGVRRESISALPTLFRKWELTKEIWATWFERLVQSEKSEPKPPSDSPRDPIHALVEALEWPKSKQETKERFRTAADLLAFNRVRIEWNHESVRGSFRVDVGEGEAGAIELRPTLSLGSPASTGGLGLLIAFHEIGHFVLHSRWLSELALMWHVADKVATREPLLGQHVRGIIDQAAENLSALYSAVEEAADEFAMSVLVSDAYLQALKAAFTSDQGTRIFDLLEVVRVRLGFPRPEFGPHGITDEFGERFSRFVYDRLGFGDCFRPLLAERRDLRAIIHRLSKQRAEQFLERLWKQMWNEITLERRVSSARRRRATKPALFSYDGIRCHSFRNE